MVAPSGHLDHDGVGSFVVDAPADAEYSCYNAKYLVVENFATLKIWSRNWSSSWLSAVSLWSLTRRREQYLR